MEEFAVLMGSAVDEGEFVLRRLARGILGRAYKDCQGEGLQLGGLTDNADPEEVRRRMAAELAEDGEAWLRGHSCDGAISCEEVLRVMRVVSMSGPDFLERALAGVPWPKGERRW